MNERRKEMERSVSTCCEVGSRLFRLWKMDVRRSSKRDIFRFPFIGRAFNPFSRNASMASQMPTFPTARAKDRGKKAADKPLVFVWMKRSLHAVR